MTMHDALVHVVDDDLSMREAIHSLLRSTGLKVEPYVSADDFLSRHTAPANTPECLVLDVRMPGLSGLELQGQLRQSLPCLPIVFITAHGDIPMTVRAIKAGAVEFLPKPFCDEELLHAVDASLELSHSSLREKATKQSLQARFDTLTPREREVLQLMMQGLRNKQTADRMGISEVTVKVHRHHIMEKMRATSLPMLINLLEQLQAI